MNTELMFSSKTDMWSTPQYIFDKYNYEFNFDLDTCATSDNAKCEKYFTEEVNGLSQNWKGTCWMNPPYGRAISKWIEKAYISNMDPFLKATVVCLLPARTDTKWFHKFIYNNKNAEIIFIKGRLKFGDSKYNAPFPSMIVIFKNKSI